MRSLLRRVSAALLLLAPLAAASTADALPHDARRDGPAPLIRSTKAVKDQYIVSVSPDARPREVAQRLGVKPRFVYRGVLRGFAARLTSEQVTSVRAHSEVTSVEETGAVSVSGTPSSPSAPAAEANSWGLDRIDQRMLPLDGDFTTRSTGRGTNVYILDTGIDYGHEEFGGRARLGFDAVGDGRRGEDCNGHGTHVAGTAGGGDHGVARDSDLYSVRVLNCKGRGDSAGFLAGMEWIFWHAERPAVMNASLGGSYSAVQNAAVDALAARGVVPVVAAGNESQNACGASPASAEGAVTIGATDKEDRQTSFSNWGPCLELYAPGKDIVSARDGGGTKTLSGTSMAAPHAAGAAALYLERNPYAGFAEVSAHLQYAATHGVVRDTSEGSPNRLLFTGHL